MTLAILICTLPERYAKLSRLLRVLEPQVSRYANQVSIVRHDAGPSMPTGRKRNELIIKSTSDFWVFIDDDDLVSDDYVEEMLKAIDTNPDVVTFKGWMSTNGTNKENFVIKLDEKYEKRDGVYYRHPNHLCAFKRSTVDNIRFPNIHIQEDYQFAMALKNQKVLKSEVHIDKELYFYLFETKRRVRR